MKQKFKVTTFENLHLRIFTIGYHQEGESILGIFCDGDKPLFSFVVDSYAYTDMDYNHVEQLLQQENIQHIDAFIWTHPDEDHSKGICELLEHYDKEHSAQIFIPAILNPTMSIGEEAQNALQYINKHYNSNRIYDKLKAVGLMGFERPECLIQLEFSERRSNTIITCNFNFFLPYNTFLQRRLGQRDFKWNDLSIFFSLYCNGYNYIFSGDLTKQCLQFITFEYLQNVRFIKIPHHGSSEIQQFAYMVQPGCYENTISTVTEKYNSGLPRQAVLNEYGRFCNTIFRTAAESQETACIETKFNISSLSTIASLTGNVIEMKSK